MNVYFIADTHLSHPSILYFKPKRRELAGITLEELQCTKWEADGLLPGLHIVPTKVAKKDLLERHDKWLVNLWNNTVKRDDVVYILGDFCLGNRERTEKLLGQLHGKKFLIRGNHDKSCNGLERYFVGVYDIKEAKFSHDQFPFIKEGETFCVEMCHYPMVTWNRKPHGTVHICGHIHGAHDQLNKETGVLRVDVGLDAELANYNLIPLEKLYSHFRNIVIENNCNTFQEYAEVLMERQGFRD